MAQCPAGIESPTGLSWPCASAPGHQSAREAWNAGERLAPGQPGRKRRREFPGRAVARSPDRYRGGFAAGKRKCLARRDGKPAHFRAADCCGPASLFRASAREALQYRGSGSRAAESARAARADYGAQSARFRARAVDVLFVLFAFLGPGLILHGRPALIKFANLTLGQRSHNPRLRCPMVLSGFSAALQTCRERQNARKPCKTARVVGRIVSWKTASNAVRKWRQMAFDRSKKPS